MPPLSTKSSVRRARGILPDTAWFPDEIVCCGPASVFVPYTDPGLKLAQAIRRETEAFIQKQQRQPRVILMQNHGIITLGGTWQSVLSAMLMAEKAAKIFVGAAALGGPVFLLRREHRPHCRPSRRGLPPTRVENVIPLTGQSGKGVKPEWRLDKA